MPLRRPPVGLSGALLAAAALALAACGTGGGDSIETESTPVPTVGGVGYLPDTVPTTTIDPNADPDDIVVDVVVSRPVDEEGVIEAQVAELVAGNRVIAIGDSILASTASRFGGELCAELEPYGWAIEVNAEPGQFVPFGNRVLDRRLPDEPGGDDDWDAAIVHLGSNYELDQSAYRDELDEILSRLAPRPTLLLTVTVYRPAWSEVNDVIDEMAEKYDNVILVDWERTARTPGVLSRDGLHPGDAGEQVLVELIAAALGDLPGAEPDCLRSQFTDDSNIGAGAGGESTGGTSGGSGGSGGTSGSSTSGGTSGGTSTSGTSGGSGVTTTTLVGPPPTGGTDGGTDGGTTDGIDDGGSTTGGTDGGTTGGTDDGGTAGGTDGGATGGTDGGADGGTTDGADGGTTSGGTTGGSTSGTTTGGSTTGGSTTGGTTGGTTTGGSTTGGTTTGGSTSGTTTGGSTTGGTTTGGSTTGGTATGGTTDGGTTG